MTYTYSIIKNPMIGGKVYRGNFIVDIFIKRDIPASSDITIHTHHLLKFIQFHPQEYVYDNGNGEPEYIPNIPHNKPNILFPINTRYATYEYLFRDVNLGYENRILLVGSAINFGEISMFFTNYDAEKLKKIDYTNIIIRNEQQKWKKWPNYTHWNIA